MTDNRLEILTCAQQICNMAIGGDAMVNSLYRIIKSYCQGSSDNDILTEAREEYWHRKEESDRARGG